MKIVLIGSGNVATILGKALQASGQNIVQVYSRKEENAAQLANKLNAKYTTQLEELEVDADIYLICSSDKAIEEIARKIKFTPKLIAHTSGNTSIEALSNFSNYGVFYPLQSFSKNKHVALSKVPICIEANTKENEATLTELAGTISSNIQHLNSIQRKQCHLAAVFANNFTNHMVHIAHNLLKKEAIDPEIINPLVEETAAKLQELSPKEAQTGPAIRNDKNTIESHLELLSDHDLEKLYSFVTQSIINYKNKV